MTSVSGFHHVTQPVPQKSPLRPKHNHWKSRTDSNLAGPWLLWDLIIAKDSAATPRKEHSGVFNVSTEQMGTGCWALQGSLSTWVRL